MSKNYRKYSVLLLYPIEMCDEIETYYGFALASSPENAAKIIQRRASNENGGTSVMRPKDFLVLLVTDGHQYDIKDAGNLDGMGTRCSPGGALH